MFFRSRSQNRPSATKPIEEAARAFERVREHWDRCESCRGAASASSSLWCAQGVELMSRGVVEHPHWDSCGQCREAQERIRSGQCSLGRELEQEYRVLVQRLARA